MKQRVIGISQFPWDRSVSFWPKEFSLSSWEDQDYVSNMLWRVEYLTNIEAIQLHHVEHTSLRIIADEDP